MLIKGLFGLLQRYSFMTVFVLMFLLGLQIPHFINTYALRLQGQLSESSLQLNEYQQLANVYFAGDMQALVKKHQQSHDPVFSEQAAIINQLIQRQHVLAQKHKLLEGALMQRMTFMLGELNSPLFADTFQAYQAQIVLNKQSITLGILLALFACLLLEIMFFSGAYLCQKGVKQLLQKISEPRL